MLDSVSKSPTSYSQNPSVGTVLTAVENHIKEQGLIQEVQAKLDALAVQIGKIATSSDFKKLVQRIKVLSAGGSQGTVTIVDKEAWSDVAIADLGLMDKDERMKWEQVLAHAVALTSTAPSKKWLSQAESILDNLGRQNFHARVIRWFPFIGKRGSANETAVNEYAGDPNELLSPNNADLLKGLVWFCSFYQDDEIARLLGNVAEACFKKVPNVGARCPKLANACVSVLSSMTFKEAIAQLSRLKTGAKNASSRKQLDKSLGNAAQRSGMTVADLEEISVPDYGFSECGHFLKQLGEFQAEIAISGPRSAQVHWTDKNGKALNSVPAAVKRDFADDAKMLKKTAADIEKLLPSVRHRIESSLLQQRHWNYKAWRERYIDHPICGALARKLIWNFNGKAGIWWQEQIVDLQGNAVELEDLTLVELWHPIGARAQDVLAWRQWLLDHNVTQPFKQAHREIYVLTDAERQTGTYSNRFAAHIIRQHQFTELAHQRGWEYTMQGGWDCDSTPTLVLPQWNLRVEFWADVVQEETAPSGIFMYLSTDQVRFSRAGTREPLNLTEIMPIVFTEVMRDVDLFVGVCSIGNDPTWQDGRQHHEYWTNYSFGDLGATAQTRKAVLQSIIPHLKIAPRCSFNDKFLVVKGDWRTYNIHLGSGNILMEPNGQYLCIVPSREETESDTGKVFLPFEGDKTLSVILSKCFLLANDSKIKDPTILSQIHRK